MHPRMTFATLIQHTGLQTEIARARVREMLPRRPPAVSVSWLRCNFLSGYGVGQDPIPFLIFACVTCGSPRRL